MINIARNDCSPSRHFIADEFRGDNAGNGLRKLNENARGVSAARRSRMLMGQRASGRRAGELVAELLKALVFANGDVFHLRRDDSLARIPKLGDGMPRRCAERFAAQSREFNQPILLRVTGILRVLPGEIAIIHRLDGATFVFGHVSAGANPRFAYQRETLCHVAMEIRIAPGAGAIIDAHRFICLALAVERLGGCKPDFAHRNPDIRMDAPLDVNARAISQWIAAVRLKRFFRCNHKVWFKKTKSHAGLRGMAEFSLPSTA